MYFTPFQKLVIFSLLFIFLGLSLYFIRLILMPFIVAFILAYLLLPLIDRMEFVFKGRLLAVLVLYAIFITAILIIGFIFIPVLFKEIVNLSNNVPVYYDIAKKLILNQKELLEIRFPILLKLQILEKFQAQGDAIVGHILATLPSFLFTIFSIVSFLFFVPIILFFFLLEGPRIKKSCISLIPNRYFEMSLNLLFKINSQLGNYLRGVFIESAIVGLLSIIFLLILGVDYAVIIGAVAGIFNLIPYLGPISGAIPAIIIFYLKMKTIKSIIMVIVLFSVVQFIDNTFVQPIVYSQSVNLHPLIIMFAVILGGTLGGFLGLAIAVPIAGIIKVILNQLHQEYQFRKRVHLEKLSLN